MSLLANPQWREEEILILVKAYPNLSKKHQEASCMAGITRSGDWIRLYPVKFRELEDEQRFKKYQWIRTRVMKKRDDPRRESHYLDHEYIQVLEEVSTTNDWALRRALLRPLVNSSLQALWERQDQEGSSSVSLGLVPVRTLLGLKLNPLAPEWSEAEKAILHQQSFLGTAPSEVLEKVPFDFLYQFRCGGNCCAERPHLMTVRDWEIYQSYRRWKRSYGDRWEWALREKYEKEMSQKDLHFFVGTQRSHPTAWIIIGLFYPPRVEAVQTVFAL